jgi:hypothetical protein
MRESKQYLHGMESKLLLSSFVLSSLSDLALLVFSLFFSIESLSDVVLLLGSVDGLLSELLLSFEPLSPFVGLVSPSDNQGIAAYQKRPLEELLQMHNFVCLYH